MWEWYELLVGQSVEPSRARLELRIEFQVNLDGSRALRKVARGGRVPDSQHNSSKNIQIWDLSEDAQ